jgi:hypothetical protein
MRGTADTGSRSSSSVGISAATSEACIARAMAQAIHPTSTNRTDPTEIQAAAPGSWVSWYITHPTTIVDGMVMTQEANIFSTTRRLTPWPEATPEPVIEEAAAWVVEMGMPMPVAPKIAVTAPMSGHGVGYRGATTKKALKLNTAENQGAHRAGRARVATTVDTELAASWNPLVKSKTSASKMTPMMARSNPSTDPLFPT